MDRSLSGMSSGLKLGRAVRFLKERRTLILPNECSEACDNAQHLSNDGIVNCDRRQQGVEEMMATLTFGGELAFGR